MCLHAYNNIIFYTVETGCLALLVKCIIIMVMHVLLELLGIPLFVHTRIHSNDDPRQKLYYIII